MWEGLIGPEESSGAATATQTDFQPFLLSLVPVLPQILGVSYLGLFVLEAFGSSVV